MRTTTSAITALLMLGTAASAADVGRPAPYFKAPPMMNAPTWTGFYIGVNAGGAFGTDKTDLSIGTTPAFASTSNAMSGVIGGGQVGYNWQFGSYVAGFEADFQGSSLKGTLNAPCAPAICAPLGLSAAYSQSVPWFGTARARIGYAQDSWLIYATGGYAYAAVDTTATATAGPLAATFNSHDTRSGWTVGGGIEVGFSQNWSAKLEYLHVDLGTARTITTIGALPVLNTDSRVSMEVVRAGVNYRF